MPSYTARWLVPISSPPIQNGVITVDGAVITYAGPHETAPSTPLTDLGNAALLPGLVNSHSHLELTVFRGLLEDLSFRDWIVALQTAKQAVMTPEHFLDSARLGIEEGLLAGVTSFADSCDSGVALRAMRDAGVRGVMYQEVFGPDPARRDASLADLRDKVRTHRELESPLVRVGVSPHAPYTVSDALFTAVAAYARDERLPMAIHIAESEAEQSLVTHASGEFADALRGRGIDVTVRGRSPLALLDALGVLALRPLLIHCVRADANDIALVASHGCAVAHCPASNAKFGHGIAPLMEMLDADIAVGLGSDSVASNNRMDILGEARLAVLGQRARTQRFDALSASQALHLATLGGATAIGIADHAGSLEVGKQADLAAFSLDDAASTPASDPIAALVYSLGARPARLVVVAGEELVRDGRLVRQNEGLRDRTPQTAAVLAAFLARSREAGMGVSGRNG